MDFKDKITLVTGASRGLGHALAEALGSGGAHVLAVARTVGALEELDDHVRARGGACTLVPLDLADDPALDRLAAAIDARWRRLDFCALCAAEAPPLSPVAHATAAELDRAFAVNARAAQRLIRTLHPLLASAAAAKVLFFDDPHEGEAYFGAYAASKAALRAIALAYAAETRSTSIDVRLVRPPPMPTALRARSHPGEDKTGLTAPTTVAERLLKALETPSKGPLNLS